MPGPITPSRLGAWALTAAYLTAVVVGTHLPDEHPAVTTAVTMSGNDRIAHYLAYAGLAGLVFGPCRAARRPARVLAIAAGLCAFGAVDELTQPAFGRSAEWLDWAADVGGVATGTLAGLAFARATDRYYAVKG